MNTFNKIITILERIIIITLITLMGIVLLLSTIEIVILIIKEFSNPFKTNGVFINIKGLVEIFGFFLTVLIGLELFETVKLYLKENVFHVEVILLVSLIAVSRKVIVLDYTEEDPMTLFAIATLIAAISFGYFFVKKSLRSNKSKEML